MSNGAQSVIGDGLQLRQAGGLLQDPDLGGLLDGVHQAEGDVEIGTGDKQAMLGPDGSLKVLHLLTGGLTVHEVRFLNQNLKLLKALFKKAVSFVVSEFPAVLNIQEKMLMILPKLRCHLVQKH